jgi:predicted helicase
MTALRDVLDTFRAASQSEREKGNYFENLSKIYFENEPKYKDLYEAVWLWEDWRKYWIEQGNSDPGTDTGIDLVARTKQTNEYHAIQAKFYDSETTLYKRHIDSFFTASGKKPFTLRLLILTTDNVSHHVDDAMQEQNTPTQKITLSDLENSKINWADTFKKKEVVLQEPKSLRDYQRNAIKNVSYGLETADRGKLIMACGTGKTFTALRLAEEVAGKGGKVLFLVPSLSLLSQTLTEWTQESTLPMHSFAVCSDSEVGKKRDKDDDYQMLVHELRYPATTNPKALANEFNKRQDDDHINVIFSTYHSIQVISDAQKNNELPEFDLIICDEAHRTTGAIYDGEDESAFVKIHNADFIKSKKRIYMTATPRVYGVAAKAKAENDSIVLYDMDNEEQYGKTLHTLSFSEAVKRGILVDYKVIVLTVSEDHISKNLQKVLADENNSLRVDDAAKIVGCWRALSKQDTQVDLELDPEPMKRAVAFCQVIEINKGAKTHKVSSKNIAGMFQKVVDEYRAALMKENPEHEDAVSQLICEAAHVDGSMNAAQKEEKLDWLKADLPENTCRVLSNVRCLSEGVDVPALDAVLFLTPRNSQVDVVQSVGRVMRKPKDSKKQLGYVILPVVIPTGMSPEEALNDNKSYKVVWEVLQALRSHDDRFDAMINKLDLAGQDRSKMEVIAITDKISPKKKSEGGGADVSKGKPKIKKAKGSVIGSVPQNYQDPKQAELNIEIGEIERAIMAKVVQKCGNRFYWDDWAKDIAKIAQTHISRITAILDNQENTEEIVAFNGFLKNLQEDLNEGISREEAIEMLAQHIITKPVFDALFEDYSFAQHNPVSMAMQAVLDVLNKHSLDKEIDTLERFYASVKMRAQGIDDLSAKQKIIVELYDKFFRNAFPRMTERLGIVYTPVEVVDFIIHSINDALMNEFGQTLGDKNVHIIDPFTGTGTFITRLLQSGLISKEQLAYKYQNEIHANEIVLLAYYIAAINIEQVYHSMAGGKYVPFDGICLTDTFALYEPSSHEIGKDTLADNSSRRRKQKKLDIRVIMGNPPYSAGQTSANDNNANVEYPSLDKRIRDSYAANSKAINKNALYDSYIRAIRWASDRIKDRGVIGFVSNAGYIDANTSDGLRKCLVKEFSSIYVFHLRGNQRTAGELSRKEGGKIFGSGSRSPIAITILVKNPDAKDPGKIYLHDIGDYLTREEKLERVADFSSINGISGAGEWMSIKPNQHHDWIGQRDDSFNKFISLGDKKPADKTLIFRNYSSGIKTNRDAWCYNFSKKTLASNIQRTIDFYNQEVARYKLSSENTAPSKKVSIEDFANKDPSKISWSGDLLEKAEKLTFGEYREKGLRIALYRPFTKTNCYFDSLFNNRTYQMPRIFPEKEILNRVIAIVGLGVTKDFSVIMTDTLADVQLLANGQCFPLKWIENAKTAKTSNQSEDLFSSNSETFDISGTSYIVSDAITDEALNYFASYYKNNKILSEDLFYYVYGLLHSHEYKIKYSDNLSKEFPRIPAVKSFEDFAAFSTAGKKLADLHLNYERAPLYPVNFENEMGGLAESDYRVTQMKFPVKADKSRVVYNHKITISDIPVEAYDYVVNGKSALEWVMERQAVTTHKDSGIVNDANDWAIETMHDPAYPLKLFQRVITVSLETMKIVNSLPKLDI